MIKSKNVEANQKNLELANHRMKSLNSKIFPLSYQIRGINQKLMNQRKVSDLIYNYFPYCFPNDIKKKSCTKIHPQLNEIMEASNFKDCF